MTAEKMKELAWKGKNKIFTILGWLSGICIEIGMAADYLPKDSRLHAVAAALGILGTALKFPGGAKAAAAVLALAFASGAYAEDTHLFCFSQDKGVCIDPGFGISGTAYDFVSHSVIKSATVSGLARLTLGNGALKNFAVLGGGGFQTGDVQGLAIQAGVEYVPLKVGAVYSDTLFGALATRSSRTVTAGYVVHF